MAQKHDAGWPDSAIIEVHGWDRSNSGSGMRMLRRYRGEIPVSRLKQYPLYARQVLRQGVLADHDHIRQTVAVRGRVP